MSIKAFAGIDVAFAKNKRLPICVVVWKGERLVPLALKHPSFPEPPRGSGNRGALDAGAVRGFARETVAFLDRVEDRIGQSIAVVAIDAPSSPCRADRKRRAAEAALDRENWSCIPTPTERSLEDKRKAAQRHLARGLPLANLPGANQFWMLVGFALFEELGHGRQCREVYPHVIFRALGIDSCHKSSADGYRAQLNAAAAITANTPRALDDALRRSVFGARHDRLDAFVAAWVAATPKARLIGYGEPPDDVIWCPKRRGEPASRRVTAL